PLNFLLRWLGTLFLVFATYNPSGRSFYHWAMSGDAPSTIVAVVAIGLAAFYIFLIRSTWRSIKPFGTLLLAIFLGLFNLMLVDLGIVHISGDWVVTVMVLISLSTLLAFGVSFSAIRARLAGQIDSDDVGR
ncbi:MAG TPA: DUF6524 family protein, partial [Hyphomicrobiales bacterium]|nr:DUF6524 family protein [Hyphomicrobiales bacterium]